MVKIVNNTEIIREYLVGVFEKCTQQALIQIQIMQRRKDKGNESMRKDTRVVKSYLVESIKHFDDVLPEIMDLCAYFKARAYINLNPKDADMVRWNLIMDLQRQVRDKKRAGLMGITDGAIATCGCCLENESTWILDIDDPAYVDEAINAVREIYTKEGQAEKSGRDIVIMQYPTVNGTHVIIRPFNKSLFQPKFVPNGKGGMKEVYDVKANTPSLMYAAVEQ